MKELLISLTVIALVLYYIIKAKLDYWKNRGIIGPSPVLFFGNFKEVFLRKLSMTEKIDNLYKEWKSEPFIGVFKSFDPQLFINDLDLIKNVLIKDFNAFPGRGVHVNEDVDPLSAHLVNIDGPRWKAVRAKLTPIFTTGKLKHMIELMVQCADNYESYLIKEIGEGNVIDCREAAAKFTIDVIGSCAFGINMNAISKDDSEFRKIGRRIFQSSFRAIIKRLIREVAPGYYRFLKLKQIPSDITEFFIRSINETIQYRKEKKVVRNDLIGLFMEIQATRNEADIEFTDELMAAQAYIFFGAGFETSSTTISFALYELAHAQEIQQRLRDEIIEILEEHKGKLSYETMNNMKYLEMVIQETLRKNPPVFFLPRRAHRDYQIPDTNVIIEKGKIVNIPVYSIHHDPQYYPEPEVFDPERFTDEAKSKRHPMAYLPFGDGPKNCIGARFAAYQVHLGIIKILKNFVVKPSKSTAYPYKIQKSAIILTIDGGVNLFLEPLSKK